MQASSPAAIRLSAELDRMERLLRATGVAAPVASSSLLPSAQLDVAACYKELEGSKAARPLDIVMRQALELYCSLISPPSTPTAKHNLSLRPDADFLPASSSEAFDCEANDTPTAIVCPAWDHRTSTDRDGLGVLEPQQYYLGYQTSNHCSWSSLSSASEPDSIDFDIDDPFASYPLAQPLLIPSRSHPGLNSQFCPPPGGRASSESTALKGGYEWISSPCQAYQAYPEIPISEPLQNGSGIRSGLKESGTSSSMTKASSADVKYTSPQLTSRRGHFNHNPQLGNPYPLSNMADSKVSGRKRAFSVVSFGKHRKSSSSNSTTLRISGPMPIISSNPTSSPRTFYGLTETPSRRRESLGCLSPAWEENEDITPIKKASLPTARTRSATASSDEEPKPMSISHKYSSRPETRSIWKSIKTTSSRTSLSSDRPFIQHSRQPAQD